MGLLMGVLGAVIVVVVVGIALAVFTVAQQTVVVIERWGKFVRMAYPGLHAKIPVVDRIADRLDLKLKQVDIEVRVKTRDNNFITVRLAVQIQPDVAKLYEAAYSLENSEAQLESWSKSILISECSKMDLNEVFAKRDDTANLIGISLTKDMEPYGWKVPATQIIDIIPDDKVVEAMNSIVASQRKMEAAKNEGEAAKIRKVKDAEAEKQSSVLHGEGVAGQRKAIIDGLKESIQEFKAAVGEDLSEAQIIGLVTTIQYFDALRAIGTSPNSTVLFMENNASAVSQTLGQIMGALAGFKNATIPKPAEST